MPMSSEAVETVYILVAGEINIWPFAEPWFTGRP